jgi:hypothetical protein
LAERSNAVALKATEGNLRGFKSLTFRRVVAHGAGADSVLFDTQEHQDKSISTVKVESGATPAADRQQETSYAAP